MIGQHHIREWTDSFEAGERLARLANHIAEKIESNRVAPDIYDQLCTLSLRIVKSIPAYSHPALFQGGSVKDAVRLGLAALNSFDKTVMKAADDYSPLFVSVERLMFDTDNRRWEDRWVSKMAEVVSNNIGVFKPETLKGFLENSIDYAGVYYTGEFQNFKKDMFEGLEHFTNNKNVIFGPGLQAILRHCYPQGLAQSDFEGESAEASLWALASVFIAMDKAQVKIPTLQIDVVIVIQALERMANVLERYPDASLQMQMADGMKALMNVTLNCSNRRLTMAENFLRPHGVRKNWGHWMQQEALKPLLTLMENSITRWNEIAVHSENKKMAGDIRHRIVLESLMAYRSLIKSHTHKKYVHPIFQKIGPGITSSPETGVSGLEEFIYRFGYKELGSLREKVTTAALSKDARLAMIDIFEDVEGFKNHVLLMFPDIRKTKFVEDLGL